MVIHNQQVEAERLYSRGSISPLEVENFAGSPTRKIRQNKSRLDLAAGGNQFQVLRELMGDYPSSDCNFVSGDSVIPDLAFDVGWELTLSFLLVLQKEIVLFIPELRKKERRK